MQRGAIFGVILILFTACSTSWYNSDKFPLPTRWAEGFIEGTGGHFLIFHYADENGGLVKVFYAIKRQNPSADSLFTNYTLFSSFPYRIEFWNSFLPVRFEEDSLMEGKMKIKWYWNDGRWMREEL